MTRVITSLEFFRSFSVSISVSRGVAQFELLIEGLGTSSSPIRAPNYEYLIIIFYLNRA